MGRTSGLMRSDADGSIWIGGFDLGIDLMGSNTGVTAVAWIMLGELSSTTQRTRMMRLSLTVPR
jgi:hypothetical protein